MNSSWRYCIDAGMCRFLKDLGMIPVVAANKRKMRFGETPSSVDDD
jgi:hypothetical protein